MNAKDPDLRGIKIEVFQLGPGLLDERPASMEWTVDDRIQIIERNYKTAEPVQTILDVKPEEIVKARFRGSVTPGGAAESPAYISLTTRERTVRVSDIEFPTFLKEPGESKSAYLERTEGQDIPRAKWWIRRLGSHGVDVKYWSATKMYFTIVGLSLAAAALLIGGIALYSFAR